MLHRTLVRRIALCCALVALPLGVFAARQAAQPGGARLQTYADAEGQRYFALSVVPSGGVPRAKSHEIVVLFDTSASQAGSFREKALATLREFLAQLGPDDHVQLLATDVKTVPLTAAAVAANSPEMNAALAQLAKREPLGTTDMPVAIAAAASRLAGAPDASRAIVYIGDGMSSANLLESDSFAKLTSDLVGKQIQVTSYAVGPQLDNQLLGALANQTGGNLAVDGAAIPVADIARFLAHSAQESVVYPKSVDLPAGLEIYPNHFPPLRGDRDTVVVGRGVGEEPFDLKVEAEVAGQPLALAWNVAPAKPSDDNGYLARLVKTAAADGGATLPIVGSAGLMEVRRLMDIAADDLNRLGRQAVATGHLDQANKLAEASREFAPGNPDAAAITGAAAKLAQAPPPPAPGIVAPAPVAAPPAGVAPGDELRIVGEPAPVDPVAEAAAAAARGEADGALLSDVERQQRVLAGALQGEVRAGLNEARRLMAEDPAAATDRLKLLLEHVRTAAEVSPAIREQLGDQIEVALQEAANRTVIRQDEEIRRQEILASAEERRRITDQLYARQERVDQLIARFDALMDESRYGDAGVVGEIANDIAPELPATTVAVVSGRMTGYGAQALDLRKRRQIGMVDALASVEASHIPTPDEPPIYYPPADVWELLTERRKEFASVSLESLKPAEKKIIEELDKPTTLDFVDTPLAEVIQYLEDYHKIQIEMDGKALEDAGLATDTPITRQLQNISLRSALRLILKELDLTYVIDDEVLMITTVDAAQDRLTTRVYPVADLVVPIQSMGGMGGMGGMMGGMGGGMGGMGGMGGGMGGMGMGGMGGGMGGMGMGGMGGGMGGMGGGMFNVPNRGFLPFLQNIPQGGFRPFAVDDDLKITGKPVKASAKSSVGKSAAPAKPAAEKKAAAKQAAVAPQPAQNAAATAKAPRKHKTPDPITLAIKEGAIADQAWNDHFAAHKEDAARVRETVRQLMHKKQFDEVQAVIRGALRNSQGQPWMFEAMALAMQAAGNSADDVERALLSALDFSNRPIDVMYVAMYLGRIGHDQRALALFQQASKMAPNQPEPFAHGLAVAQRLNDLEGLKWSLCGILSQAWPEEHMHLWKKAYNVAAATLEQLKNENRQDEAESFEKALDAAVVRDIVVEATWDGDCDVDLMVEEPTGTICSSRNPRTTAGGALVQDAFPNQEKKRAHGYQEVYACPQGFTGNYRVLVRRMWGKPAGGKVTVDIYLHTRSDQFEHIRKQVPVGDEDALLVFDLKGGRRTESLTEQQVATAASDQISLRRELINQQLNAMADEYSLRDLAKSRGQIADRGAGVPIIRTPSVGYQPVIIVLPEGANLRASAVISADRRYVRFTGLPLFSSVSEVNTFNFATGQSGTSNGGTGGQGFSGSGAAGGTGTGTGGFGT